MAKTECDIATIGAGVAGLAATSRLKAAGKDVICLEATDRTGGRILTVHDPLAALPIELGAEFVHGVPPEIWQLIHQEGLTAYEHTPEALYIDRGRVLKNKQVGQIADRVLSQLGKPARKKDESFADYLHHSRLRADVKDWARVHVEGFNAAPAELVSAASLMRDADAAEEIEGDRTFRILNGYDSIPISLLRGIAAHQSVVHLNCVVECVRWRRGAVEVQYTKTPDKEAVTLRCRRLIVTASIGVLQAAGSSRGSMRFDPVPGRILQAAAALQLGQAYRVTFPIGKSLPFGVPVTGGVVIDVKMPGTPAAPDGAYPYATLRPVKSVNVATNPSGVYPIRFVRPKVSTIELNCPEPL